ncbi:hypothetical protein [Glycomyces algeriensis]|nr:hypothetical protein [Glycomyces algeriensis]MDA1367922.1 hypothetical protein [Glycomyces algeriensis]MDR7349461.1 hypothetical protein [Glycomyces algeriensis]
MRAERRIVPRAAPVPSGAAMTFDADRYRAEVLRPLRLRPGLLPSSFEAKYGLFEPLTGEALAVHAEEVRRFWAVTAGGVGTLAEVCARLAASDDPGSDRRFETAHTGTYESTASASGLETDARPRPVDGPVPPVREAAEPDPVPGVEPPVVEHPPRARSERRSDPGPAVPAPAPVAEVRAEWLSDHLRVAWEWPEGVNWVRVTLVPGRRTAAEIVSGIVDAGSRDEFLPEGFQTRNLSRNQYFAQGGCVLPWEGPPGSAQIRSLRRGPDGDTILSEPVEVRVSPPRITVTWTAEPPPRFASRDRKRTWIIRGSIEGDGTDLELAVVAQRGTVVPSRLEQRAIISRIPIGGLLGGFDFPVEVPAKLGRPYTLRCFVIGDRHVEVVDPSFTTLKG